jgi:hypothetical protein
LLVPIQIHETLVANPAALSAFEHGMLDYLSDDEAL